MLEAHLVEEVFGSALNLHNFLVFADLELLVAQHALLVGGLGGTPAASVRVPAHAEVAVEQKPGHLKSSLVKSG